MHDDQDASGARLPYRLHPEPADHFVVLDPGEWQLIATWFGSAPQMLPDGADETVVRRLVQRGLLEQVERRARDGRRAGTQPEAVPDLADDTAEQPILESPWQPPSPAPSPALPPVPVADPYDTQWPPAPEPEEPAPSPFRPMPGEPAPTPSEPPAASFDPPPSFESPAASTAEGDRRRALEDLLRDLSS